MPQISASIGLGAGRLHLDRDEPASRAPLSIQRSQLVERAHACDTSRRRSSAARRLFRRAATRSAGLPSARSPRACASRLASASARALRLGPERKPALRAARRDGAGRSETPMSGPCAGAPPPPVSASPRSSASPARSRPESTPVLSATRFVSAVNSIALQKATAFAPSTASTARSSSGTSSGTSVESVTSLREMRACSANSIRFSRRFCCLISGARESSVSRSPYSSRSCAAVFGPMPGTPGTLSVESPTSDCSSIIFSG